VCYPFVSSPFVIAAFLKPLPFAASSAWTRKGNREESRNHDAATQLSHVTVVE
jgi:hypothetical protein